MNRTSPPRSAQRVRFSEEIPDPPSPTNCAGRPRQKLDQMGEFAV